MTRQHSSNIPSIIFQGSPPFIARPIQLLLAENLSTFQKDTGGITNTLFQATKHILAWAGLVTCHLGKQENTGEACSGCVCLS